LQIPKHCGIVFLPTPQAHFVDAVCFRSTGAKASLSVCSPHLGCKIVVLAFLIKAALAVNSVTVYRLFATGANASLFEGLMPSHARHLAYQHRSLGSM
jgi:hypothetical protein